MRIGGLAFSVCLMIFAAFFGGSDPDGSILPEIIDALICMVVSQVLAYPVYGLGELVERVKSIDKKLD